MQMFNNNLFIWVISNNNLTVSAFNKDYRELNQIFDQILTEYFLKYENIIKSS